MVDYKYLGFVTIQKENTSLPEPAAIRRVASLLKSKKKEARALHPLFARGLDTPLQLQVISETSFHKTAQRLCETIIIVARL